MTDEIKIWVVSGSSPGTPVPSLAQTKTEEWLEDALVANPEMLAPGLTLVGRQTPAAGGALDLLGVDQDDRLVVFELKKGTLVRDAVAQVIDYCSYLESLDDDELATHIAKQSGSLGIDKIEFAEWYGERTGGKPLGTLKPIRMVLVGLGVDDSTSRMVSFLESRDVEISLLTFHGYRHNDETLLAREVQRTDAATKKEQISVGERERALAERAASLGIRDWTDAVDSFTKVGTYSRVPLRDGFTFYLSALKLAGNVSNYHGSHSLRFGQSGRLRITFFPAAVHLCEKQFEQQGPRIPFSKETPPNAPRTNEVAHQWYCLLDSDEWKTHRTELTGLAFDVYSAWAEARRNANGV